MSAREGLTLRFRGDGKVIDLTLCEELLEVLAGVWFGLEHPTPDRGLYDIPLWSGGSQPGPGERFGQRYDLLDRPLGRLGVRIVTADLEVEIDSRGHVGAPYLYPDPSMAWAPRRGAVDRADPQFAGRPVPEVYDAHQVQMVGEHSGLSCDGSDAPIGERVGDAGDLPPPASPREAQP